MAFIPARPVLSAAHADGRPHSVIRNDIFYSSFRTAAQQTEESSLPFRAREKIHAKRTEQTLTARATKKAGLSPPTLTG